MINVDITKVCDKCGHSTKFPTHILKSGNKFELTTNNTFFLTREVLEDGKISSKKTTYYKIKTDTLCDKCEKEFQEKLKKLLQDYNMKISVNIDVNEINKYR